LAREVALLHPAWQVVGLHRDRGGRRASRRVVVGRAARRQRDHATKQNKGIPGHQPSLKEDRLPSRQELILAIEPERDVLDAFRELDVETEAVALGDVRLGRTHHAKGPHDWIYYMRVLDMPLALQAAANEYIGWLQLEANRSPNTVRAYDSEIRRLLGFLAANGHALDVEHLRHEDLRAFQRHLAGRLKSPASRARALVAIRSWLRWIAREGLLAEALPNGTTLPKLEQPLPKPIDPDELARLLAALPRSSLSEKRSEEHTSELQSHLNLVCR